MFSRHPLMDGALMAVLSMASAAGAHAGTIVFQHDSYFDPLSEGWGITPGDNTSPGVIDDFSVAIEVGPVFDNASGSWVWGIDNWCCTERLRYEGTPSAAPSDWTLRARMRPALEDDSIPGSGKDVDAAILMEYSEGPTGQRHGVVWGGDPLDGSAIIGIFGDPNEYVIPGGNVYHLYELTSTGELYVDGVLLLSGLTGVASNGVARRVNFGDGQSSATGRSYWDLVQWEEGPQACNDGIDNDNDGVTDFAGGDPSCQGPGDMTEDTADEDGDGLSDGEEVNLTGTDPAAYDLFQEQMAVAVPGSDSITRVIIATGDRAYYSRSGSPGSGPGIPAPYGLVLDPATGDFLAADFIANLIIRVDPVTGDRSVVSGGGTGAGTALVDPVHLAVDPNGHILAADFGLDAVLRIDPATGDRMEVSDASLAAGGMLGAGPNPTDLRDIAVDPNGDILVVDPTNDFMLRIDPVTGDRTIVFDAATGGGPALIDPFALEFDAAGQLWVATLTGLYQVDPITGDRTAISDATTGAGPALLGVLGLTFDLHGNPVLADNGTSSIVRVNPITGDRTAISSSTLGSGPALADMREVVHLGPPLDQDGDGLTDWFEVRNGFDPLITGEQTLDPDGDGLDNLGEQNAGTDPHVPDTDGDGLTDGDEVTLHGTNPVLADTDGDGVSDGDEILVHGTSPFLVDSDGDGLIDGFEVQYGLNPLAAGDEVLDPDGDGLDNLAEQSLGTHPNVPDTDGDGVNDGQEIALTATDPAVPDPFGPQFLVSDPSQYGLYWVAPDTGNRRLVAGPGLGGIMTLTNDVALHPTLGLLVADHYALAIMKLNPNTAAWSAISAASLGSGPPFAYPTGLDVEAGGTIVVADYSRQAVMRVDPATGDRTILSQSGVAGSGPQLYGPWDLAIDPNGGIFVADYTAEAVVHVDPATGDRTVISSLSVGSGPAFEGNPVGLRFDPSGQMWVASLQGLYRVDPVTGDRTLVSGGGIGSGPDPILWSDVDFDTNGIPVLVDYLAGAVIRVDPATGDRGVISDAATGSGPALVRPATILLVDGLDQDDDGLPDLDEATIHGTDPLMADTDGDGLSDGDEVFLYGSDPLLADTDGDGLLDGFEAAHGFDPSNPGEEGLDPDGDGLDNLGEQAAGTDPHDADSDGDGLSDGQELVISLTNPAFPNPFARRIATSVHSQLTLLDVDPNTGDRMILSGIGRGGDLYVLDMALHPGLGLLAVEYSSSIKQVDLRTGAQSIISDETVGTGPGFFHAIAVDVEADGTIVAADTFRRAVMRVDPATGNRTFLSTAFLPGGGSAGSGPDLPVISDLAVAPGGDIYVVDRLLHAVVNVDPVTGDRTVVSDDSVGSGPAFVGPMGLGFDGLGQLWVTDGDALYLVDPATGDRTLVSSGTMGSGPAPGTWFRLDLDGSGRPLLADNDQAAVFRVDPATGDRTVVSGTGIGSGPSLDDPYAILTIGPLDQDGDGVTDLDEVLTHGTDPHMTDTDGDGLTDGFEVQHGFNPLAVGDEGLDPDGDGLDNLGEQAAGTDPLDPDTDGDGLSDGDEVALTGTDPAAADLFREQIWVAHGGITQVLLATGDRSYLSKSGVVGSGPPVSPYGIVRDPATGDLLAADFTANLIMRIDPATGDRTVVSGGGTGTGEAFVDPVHLTLDPNGQILVTDFGLDAVLRIDPASGDRTIVSDASLSGGGMMGSGPNPTDLRDIEVDSNGDIFVVDPSKDFLLRIDPVTGDRVIVSDAITGSGPAPIDPFAIEFDGSGLLWLATKTTLLLIDPATGDRTVVSDAATGSGPAFQFVVGLTLDSLGRPLLADLGSEHIVRVDPSTGDRTVISGPSLGTGPSLAGLRETVYVIPLDQDGDGLFDLDEVTSYGTDPLATDTDGDRVDDGQEVLDGTDPLGPLSFLHMMSIDTVGAGDVEMTWSTICGRRYEVGAISGTAPLTGAEVYPAVFTSPQVEEECPEGTETFMDPAPAVPPGGYKLYRIRTLP